jgi:N-acetylneuraminate synthase
MIETVSEIGINASGSVEIAKKLIDVSAVAEIDFVKFQKRTVEWVYTPEELDSLRESPWGTTFREQKLGLEFDFDEYTEISAYCHSKGMKWFASVWDMESAEFIDAFNVPYIKVPSALITNKNLLGFLKDCMDTPIILSTGMSTMGMVDDAISILGKNRIYCIMHCTSTYPSQPDEQNLKCILTLKERYPWAKIGFSNHLPGLPIMIAATALGAEMVEFHVTLDRASYGSDQAASIEPEGVFRLGKWMRSMEQAMGDGEKRIYDSEIPIMEKLRR